MKEIAMLYEMNVLWDTRDISNKREILTKSFFSISSVGPEKLQKL